MNFDYSIEKNDNYLYLNISGQFEINEFLNLPALMKAECEKEKIFKVLVNGFNINGTNLSTIDRFSMGERIAHVFSSNTKIAVLWPDKHNNQFAETVAINRGADFRVFGNMEAAKEWLVQ